MLLPLLPWLPSLPWVPWLLHLSRALLLPLLGNMFTKLIT